MVLEFDYKSLQISQMSLIATEFILALLLKEVLTEATEFSVLLFITCELILEDRLCELINELDDTALIELIFALLLMIVPG